MRDLWRKKNGREKDLLMRGGFLFLSAGLGLGIWWAAAAWGKLPAFILPSPELVWQRFWQALGDGVLLRHAWYTLVEVLLGLLMGASLAALLGYFLSKSPVVERLVSPYLVASQAVPIAAIAPLLVIWFGSGMFSKVLICALIVFFPVLINTAVGVRSVPENLRDLMRSLRATPWQTLRHLEIPAAMPVFLGGMRIGATLAVIGAVVGELVGSDRGLGFLVTVSKNQYDTAMVFVAVFTLIFMALCLYGAVLWIEKRTLGWQKKSR